MILNFQTQKYIKILFYSIFGQRKKYQNNFQTQKFINKFFFSFLLIFLSKFQIFERKCDFYNSVNQFFFFIFFSHSLVVVRKWFDVDTIMLVSMVLSSKIGKFPHRWGNFLGRIPQLRTRRKISPNWAFFRPSHRGARHWRFARPTCPKKKLSKLKLSSKIRQNGPKLEQTWTK